MDRKYTDIKSDTEKTKVELEDTITGFLQLIHSQSDKIEELDNAREKELDSIFKDLLTVLDAFDKADTRLEEQFPDNDEVNKARKRFATTKKKLIEILNKNGVSEITFPTGIATLDDCQIEETEPDASKPNDAIISIEKAGYRRNGRLLRLAEVIVVKN
jgi:molecular chaperone GrpE (heat shock protein)